MIKVNDQSRLTMGTFRICTGYVKPGDIYRLDDSVFVPRCYPPGCNYLISIIDTVKTHLFQGAKSLKASKSMGKQTALYSLGCNTNRHFKIALNRS